MVKEEWMTYRARDFSQLQFAFFSTGSLPANTAIIMIHGITAEIEHHREFANSLEFEADVFLPVLRGYDRLNRRGDLSYMGQYDDDLLDFIHYVRNRGYDRIILAGHSMGCANLLRIIHSQPQAADDYVFISPFFHPALPVYQDGATEQFNNGTDVDYTVYEKKAVILMTLYKMKITAFTSMTVAEIPDEFGEEDRIDLSFTLLVSRFLEKLPDHLFQGLEKRVLAFVGMKDEVIQADKLADWYRSTYHLPLKIIRNVDHNHILHDKELHTSMAAKLKSSC